MKNIKFIILLASLAFCGTLFADFYSDFAEYDAGKSQKWFHFLRKQSVNTSKSAAIEEKILDVLNNKKVSDEAFRLACIILKPIATSDSVEVMSRFLDDKNRVVPACDVLQTLDSSDADDALVAALDDCQNEVCAAAVLNALAARKGNVDTIIDATTNNSRLVRKQATLALSRTLSGTAIDELLKIAKGKDARLESAYLALCAQAQKAYSRGDTSLARLAISGVPVRFTMSVVVRGEVSENPQSFYDALVAKDVKSSDMAGRALSDIRSFEDSAETLKNFSKLSPRAKTIVIGSMIPTSDLRYWKYIADGLDSEDEILKAETIYAARSLCEDEASLKKILKIARSSNRTFASLARKVITENPSYIVDKILREQGDAVWALEMRCQRADKVAEEILWKKFFDGEWKNPKFASVVERTINFGNVKYFAAHLKTAKDEELKTTIGKIVIKILASARKTGQSGEFMAKAFPEVIGANLSKDDPIYKLAESRLGIKKN